MIEDLNKNLNIEIFLFAAYLPEAPLTDWQSVDQSAWGTPGLGDILGELVEEQAAKLGTMMEFNIIIFFFWRDSIFKGVTGKKIIKNKKLLELIFFSTYMQSLKH